MLQWWRRTGHLPSFFVPTPGDLTAQESPLPGICYPRQKNANARGSAQGGGWAQVELHDWSISNKICSSCDFYRTKETCFTKSDVTPVYGVIPALFYPIRWRYSRNLSKLDLLQSSSFCSNVSKQVARFCRPFYSSFQWRLGELANVNAPFCW